MQRGISTFWKATILEKDKGLLSKIYKILSDPTNPKDCKMKLGKIIEYCNNGRQVERCMCETNKHLADVASMENFYKILYRQYYKPVWIASMSSNLSNKCWRGNRGRGILAHIWQECPRVKKYWSDIRSSIRDIVRYMIQLNPSTILLGRMKGQQERACFVCCKYVNCSLYVISQRVERGSYHLLVNKGLTCGISFFIKKMMACK